MGTWEVNIWNLGDLAQLSPAPILAPVASPPGHDFHPSGEQIGDGHEQAQRSRPVVMCAD